MDKEIIIKNDIAELARLTEFVDLIGEECELDFALTMSLNLALEEAVSNIILYAYPQKMGDAISVKATHVNSSLLFTISDSGVEFDPTVVPEADITLSAEDRQIGGLGIFLIRKIMDEVKYERIDGKNVLIVKKNL